jgi:RND family efflux transporter MFP subunit
MGTNVRARVIMTAGVAMLSACSHGSAQQGPPPSAVEIAPATRGNIATYVVLDGQVAPQFDATLATAEAGSVAAVYVNEGDHVRKGQLLVKLDDSQLQAQLIQAKGSVAQAAATLSSQRIQDPITRTATTSAVTNAEQALTQAQNALRADIAAEANAKLVNDSNQQLVKQGYVSQTSAVQANATYVAAQQTTLSARNAVVAAQAALATARRNTLQTKQQTQTIAGAQGSLENAQGQVKLLEAQIAQTNIVAPFDGVVTQRLLDPGAYAGPSQPAIRVSHVGTVYLNVNVPDDDLAYVHRGAVASFTSSSLPGKTFSGPITEVNAIPTTGTLSYRARITMPNPGEVLRGGMLVAVSIKKAGDNNVVIVPRSAVQDGPDGESVFTVSPAPAPPAAAAGKGPAGPPVMIAKKVPVRLGIETDTQAEVASPEIKAGTSVITTRPDNLQDKSPVLAMGAR